MRLNTSTKRILLIGMIVGAVGIPYAYIAGQLKSAEYLVEVYKAAACKEPRILREVLEHEVAPQPDMLRAGVWPQVKERIIKSCGSSNSGADKRLLG